MTVGEIKRPLSIAFAIKAMAGGGGGAERVLAEVANEFARRGQRVWVISWDDPESTDFYPLDPAIVRRRLGLGDAGRSARLGETLRRIRATRRELLAIGPDIAVGFMHSMYIPLGLALAGTGIPLIGSDHIVYDHFRTRPLERHLLNLAPLFCKAITVVSESARQSYPKVLRRAMVVMPNPVAARVEDRADVRGSGPHKRILSVGRLAPQKSQSTLIRAFANLADEFPEWNLRIVGEGELHAELQSLIQALGLADRVSLPGAIADIGAEFASAQLFALPSLYESFGLVTAEAFAHGLPVVGFADCPGTNALVHDGIDGLLVSGDDRIAALTAGLARLMSNDQLRIQLGAQADLGVAAFSPATVGNLWENLLDACVASPRSAAPDLPST